MRILVTGGAGFIGSHLAHYLFSQGYEVHVLDDLSGGYLENVNPIKYFWQIDLRNRQAVRAAMKFIRPAIVYHLAADATEGRSQFTPIGCTGRNYMGTLNLLVETIKNGLEKVVFTSSMAVYGAQKPPFTEEMKPEPEDIYGISKAACEKAIEILAKVHGFEYCIVRPHNIYGPHQNMADPYRNVVAIFTNKLLKKKPFYIYGDGEQRRAFTYIDDIIPPLASCGFLSKANSQIFNLGSDTPHTVNDLARNLIEISGIKVKPIYLPSRPQEVKFAFSDHTKVKRILGYEDKTPLKEGLLKTWAWAKTMGPQIPKYMEVELGSDNLPESWRKRLI